MIEVTEQIGIFSGSGTDQSKGIIAVSDDQLYQKYLAGDPSAGDELMLRYGNAVTAYLDGFLHNAEDAEDLMLDCFAAILVNKPRISEGHFRAYLFKIARNKANHLWKLRFKRQEFSLDEELAETLPAKEASPEEASFNLYVLGFGNTKMTGSFRAGHFCVEKRDG